VTDKNLEHCAANYFKRKAEMMAEEEKEDVDETSSSSSDFAYVYEV
jgi:hypothetical protein